MAAKEALNEVLNLTNADRDRVTAKLWALRAQVFQASGNWPDAYRSAQLAARLGEHSAEVQETLARVWAAKGGLPGLSEALEALNRRSALLPKDPSAWLELARMELRLAEVLEGLKDAEGALERRRRARREVHTAGVFAPKDPAVPMQLARVWLALGDREPARAAAQDASALGGEAFNLPDELKALLAP